MEKNQIAKTVFLRDAQVVNFTYHLVRSVSPLIEIGVPVFLVDDHLNKLVIFQNFWDDKADFWHRLLTEPVFAQKFQDIRLSKVAFACAINPLEVHDWAAVFVFIDEVLFRCNKFLFIRNQAEE